ncbi:putative signal transducing protein [Yeosuana marina]|uniref:putative signal transducing protein n=1 Tax=Yeosuana marina TaxID=1565536 RepID=UPI0030EB40B5
MESDLLVLKSRLEFEGIPCFLKNQFTTQVMNYMPAFEVELQVSSLYLEKAREIMGELENY